MTARLYEPKRTAVAAAAALETHVRRWVRRPTAQDAFTATSNCTATNKWGPVSRRRRRVRHPIIVAVLSVCSRISVVGPQLPA